MMKSALNLVASLVVGGVSFTAGAGQVHYFGDAPKTDLHIVLTNSELVIDLDADTGAATIGTSKDGHRIELDRSSANSGKIKIDSAPAYELDYDAGFNELAEAIETANPWCPVTLGVDQDKNHLKVITAQPSCTTMQAMQTLMDHKQFALDSTIRHYRAMMKTGSDCLTSLQKEATDFISNVVGNRRDITFGPARGMPWATDGFIEMRFAVGGHDTGAVRTRLAENCVSNGFQIHK